MGGGDWLVVGNFDLPSTVCLVFGDGDTILSAFGRNTYNQANVLLESPAAFTVLTHALKANPSLHLKAQHEAEIFEQNMQQLNGILNFINYFVGAIMALAATIGAANSLYAIVDGRRRKLAILRAVGFNATPIIASVVSESILLALPGALIGALVAWLLFNGLLASPCRLRCARPDWSQPGSERIKSHNENYYPPRAPVHPAGALCIGLRRATGSGGLAH
jgi:putative ABC transport system permease protein